MLLLSSSVISLISHLLVVTTPQISNASFISPRYGYNAYLGTRQIQITNHRLHGSFTQSNLKRPNSFAAASSSLIQDAAPTDNLERKYDIQGTMKKIDLFLTRINDKNDFISNTKEIIETKIQESHQNDLKFCSSFPSEGMIFENKSEKRMKMRNSVTYETIEINGGNSYDDDAKPSFLAVHTIDEDNPILDKKSISTIINAAELSWFGISDTIDGDINNSNERKESGKKETKSRFTYQRKGNYEAHLIDLANSVDDRIHTIMDDALLNRIYPMVRDAFQNEIPDIDEIQFCVYDSLVIRYNATEALMLLNKENIDCNNETNMIQDNAVVVGAGQPLHRDLGIVSVNIMLNSEDNFVGGGTFFEEQMRQSLATQSGNSSEETIIPLKPTGVGQALAHLSSNRHAGAGTKNGVRDILVIFLSAKNRGKRLIVPTIEKAARLKFKAREHAKGNEKEEAILHRIVSHKLAIENVSTDGEAWHYLGMALREYALSIHLKNSQNLSESLSVTNLATSCLLIALSLTPCDGRLCNNLGLVHEAFFRLNRTPESIRDEDDFIVYTSDEQRLISSFYERSLNLHRLSTDVGCEVSFDLDQTCLNYGLFLSKQDRFIDAAKVLSHFNNIEAMRKQVSDPNHLRIMFDGRRLYQFCTSKASLR